MANSPPPPTITVAAPEPSEEEKITLFAPFEALKPSKSRFQRSMELDLESTTSGSPDMKKEIEFQSSEAQTGNAKVFFRKIKAAVSGSGSSTNSLSSDRTPSPVAPVTSSLLGAEGEMSFYPQLEGTSLKARHLPRPTPRSSVASGSYKAAGGEPVSSVQSASEDPQISLTSYSDAHSRSTRPAGGGVARPGAHAGEVGRSQPRPGGGVARPPAQTSRPGEGVARKPGGGVAKPPGGGVTRPQASSKPPGGCVARPQAPAGGCVTKPQGGGMARPQAPAGGGVARPQSQAVNKTEMLKRFGSIADNQVQVNMA